MTGRQRKRAHNRKRGPLWDRWRIRIPFAVQWACKRKGTLL
jgi:hypothetical protein